MLSILVCHSYFLRFDPKQVERAKPYPPLATLQVAAILRQAGHEVALFDAMLADGIEEYERASSPRSGLNWSSSTRILFNFLEQNVPRQDAGRRLHDDRQGEPLGCQGHRLRP